MVKKKRFTVPFFHVISNSSGPSTGSVSIDQPWPTLKEKEGLNSSVRYSPGSRAFSTSGRGRPLASSLPPAPPQALSVKTRSVPSSPTTSSAALALRLLTLVMPIILPSPYYCGRERALSATPPRVGYYMSSILPYRSRRITQIDYLWYCLELLAGSELLRTPSMRSSQHAPVHPGSGPVCSHPKHRNRSAPVPVLDRR